MEKTLEAIQAALGRKLKGAEKEIFAITKNDDRYEFRVGDNGFLEAHAIKQVIEPQQH
ncbi:hypothetical protein LZD49_28545 [Dyadobacter sp. CY261]|uniref:hypothetical protein n=1 Tax=Dyadobacter sp. CY261 TaxID=2907203 RepID=UPI001F24AB70|nr:hypothetical protein [Dyadobacter sp. CY261]MCF0074468.1 hypothetical protein [Dyadobacter sp. CY261]